MAALDGGGVDGVVCRRGADGVVYRRGADGVVYRRGGFTPFRKFVSCCYVQISNNTLQDSCLKYRIESNESV
jgi:hypothetical protein